MSMSMTMSKNTFGILIFAALSQGAAVWVETSLD